MFLEVFDSRRLYVPVPVSFTDCGLEKSLSVIATVPVLVPFIVGVKVTLMEQLAPGAKLAPQVFVWAKSPLAVIVPITSDVAALLVIVIVTTRVVLVPTLWLPKFRLGGESVTLVPMPCRYAMCASPPGPLCCKT